MKQDGNFGMKALGDLTPYLLQPFVRACGGSIQFKTIPIIDQLSFVIEILNPCLFFVTDFNDLNSCQEYHE